jgi:hypothetical protein
VSRLDRSISRRTLAQTRRRKKKKKKKKKKSRMMTVTFYGWAGLLVKMGHLSSRWLRNMARDSCCVSAVAVM